MNGLKSTCGSGSSCFHPTVRKARSSRNGGRGRFGLRGGPRLAKMLEQKAGADQCVDIGFNGPVILDDTIDKPARVSLPFLAIVIDRPISPMTLVVPNPACRVGGAERMLYGKYKVTTRFQGLKHTLDHAGIVFDVM